MTLPLFKYTSEISRLQMPLPFLLRYVNCYFIYGSQGVTVIDPGLHTQEAEEIWDAVLSELKAHHQQIEQIVLTHHHPDHYGMAGWLQERTLAPVLLSKSAHQQAQALWGEQQVLNAQLLECFTNHGLPLDLHIEMTKHMESFVNLVSPHPQVTAWVPEWLRMGDHVYEVIETPGHAAGHLCFYHAESQHIFCGDHVLPQITPNVSFLPGVEANPLGAYLNSLHEVSQLPVKFAYPGHREPWSHFSHRATELIAHHHERLAKMNALLLKPMSAYEVCQAIFGYLPSVHQLRFALSETIAHLEYMVFMQQIIHENKHNGAIKYMLQ
jgi:glyoxylase-like metal-dependent hydrolase (beta-lactamase superfamily II)